VSVGRHGDIVPQGRRAPRAPRATAHAHGRAGALWAVLALRRGCSCGRD
jgi:hypothetical protein